VAAKLIVSTPKWKSDTVRGAGLQEVRRSIVRAGPRPAGPKLGICAWGERVRFLAKLCKHEEEHVAKARREMETVVAETNRMRGEGHAETERAAKEDLITQLYDASIGKLDTRLATLHATFDKATGHGPTRDLTVGT